MSAEEDRKADGNAWDLPPREILGPVKPFVRRVAALSVPLVNARRPMFAAALPMEVEDGAWLGQYLQDLAAGGVQVENYIAHAPTLSALERIMNFKFPPAANDGRKRRYVAAHRDLQVSLTIRQRIEEGHALTPEELDGLIRDGKVALTAIYYY